MSVILSGIEDNSTIDWYGKSSTVLFFSGCNLRCGFCYNHQMMEKLDGERYSFEKIQEIIDNNLPFINAIVITGGEPTTQAYELILLCRMIKEKYDLDIMLDTNGTKPNIIKQMFEEGLVDRLALDVKNALRDYDYKDVDGTLRRAVPIFVRETMMLTKSYGVPLEVRTTMIPTINDLEYQITSMAKTIRGYADAWYLQQFQPFGAYDREFRKIKRPTREEMLRYASFARLSNYLAPLYIKTIENGFEEMPLTVRDINGLLLSIQY